MRLLTLILAGLLALVHAELWFGKSGVPHVMRLQGQVRDQLKKNSEASAVNAQLLAEVTDLREGLETVEEKARFDSGMIRPNEILVQFAPKK